MLAAADTAQANGATPLYAASAAGHGEVVRELLARGALPGGVANDGSTAISRAAANGHPAIVQLLRAALGFRVG